MDWFKLAIVFMVLSFFAVVVLFIVAIYQQQDYIKVVKLTEQQRQYYGSEQPIYIDGNFVAVYEPITSDLRKPTLKDKLFYGELNGN